MERSRMTKFGKTTLALLGASALALTATAASARIVCNADGECASKHCSDGVCCNVACTGPCVSCAQPGRLGTCGPTSLGAADPHGICARSPASSCGQSGVCDGHGTCTAGPTVICAPFTCDAITNTCAATCASDSDCVGSKCVNGSCGPKPTGAVCTAGSQCASGFCADGVC